MLGERRAAGPLPARRPRGVAGRGRARAATGTCSTTRGCRCRRPPTTPSGSSARCSRSASGIQGQDFEPRPSYEICSLVRLPAHLPGVGGLSSSRSGPQFLSVPRWRRKRWNSWAMSSADGTSSAGLEFALLLGLQAAGPAPRSPGWRRRRDRPAPRSARLASSSSEASTAIPVSPSRRRSSASAAFGLGTAAT